MNEEQERKARKTKLEKRSSDFVNGFCEVAVQTSAIVEILLPQSPEYTITYGLLTILFKVPDLPKHLGLAKSSCSPWSPKRRGKSRYSSI
jgi:hypothetical protein